MKNRGMVISIGWFQAGKPINWSVEPKEILQVMEDGTVTLDGVEIVPWTESCRKSKKTKDWIKPGVQ